MVRVYELLKSYPNMSRRITCRDLMFTQYDCPQTEKKERFYVEQNLIAYVISGKRIFHKVSQSWILSEGTCVFVRKGTHISEIENGEGWCVMAFYMPDHFLKQLITDNQRNLPLTNLPEAPSDHVLTLKVNEICRSFFLSMFSYFSQPTPPPENLVELNFRELVLSLLCDPENRSLLAFLNHLRQDRVPSVEDVVENNFTFNLTLEEYANLACRSVPTLKREFKKIFKESPARWVMKKRLNLAVELLQNTDLSIREITFECGFENQTHFSRIFKEKMGVPPLKFRMNCLSTANPAMG